MGERVRLHKYIANAGYCSRRRAELLIQAGLVQVNGQTVRKLGTTIDPEKDVVTIHGEVIVPPEPLTIMLNKPAGFISSTHDTHDRLTVMDLLPRWVRNRGVVPVGRLDLDTEGLLLLTNDGRLHHLVTHPRHGCPKEYLVTITGTLKEKEISKLKEGVELEDGPTLPVKVLEREEKVDSTDLRVELREGRKREIKRLFQALGHRVLYLKRTRIGPIPLGDLPRGAWRELCQEEIQRLIASCKGQS